MAVELEAGLVVLGGFRVVVERPPASAMDQPADLALLSRPEADNPAAIALLAPFGGEQMSRIVQWGGELIATLAAAIREFMVACKLKLDAFHRHGAHLAGWIWVSARHAHRVS